MFHTPLPLKNTISQDMKFLVTCAPTQAQTYVHTANILMAGLTHNNLILIHPDCHDMEA